MQPKIVDGLRSDAVIDVFVAMAVDIVEQPLPFATDEHNEHVATRRDELAQRYCAFNEIESVGSRTVAVFERFFGESATVNDRLVTLTCWHRRRHITAPKHPSFEVVTDIAATPKPPKSIGERCGIDCMRAQNVDRGHEIACFASISHLFDKAGMEKLRRKRACYRQSSQTDLVEPPDDLRNFSMSFAAQEVAEQFIVSRRLWLRSRTAKCTSKPIRHLTERVVQ